MHSQIFEEYRSLLKLIKSDKIDFIKKFYEELANAKCINTGYKQQHGNYSSFIKKDVVFDQLSGKIYAIKGHFAGYRCAIYIGTTDVQVFYVPSEHKNYCFGWKENLQELKPFGKLEELKISDLEVYQSYIADYNKIKLEIV